MADERKESERRRGLRSSGRAGHGRTSVLGDQKERPRYSVVLCVVISRKPWRLYCSRVHFSPTLTRQWPPNTPMMETIPMGKGLTAWEGTQAVFNQRY